MPQETTTEVDALRSTVRTNVPFKIGQRHNGQRVEGVLLQDLRIYGRALLPVEVEQLAKGARFRP